MTLEKKIPCFLQKGIIYGCFVISLGDKNNKNKATDKS